MTTFKNLRPSARLYVLLVILAGATVISDSVHRLFVDPISNRWVVLALLTLLTASFNLKVPSINAYISVSEAFVFASVLFFGTPAGTATVVVECLVMALWIERLEERRIVCSSISQRLPSQFGHPDTHSIFCREYSRTRRRSLRFQYFSCRSLHLPPCTFLVNSWLVALAVASKSNNHRSSVWWKNFAWLSVNYFSGAYCRGPYRHLYKAAGFQCVSHHCSSVSGFVHNVAHRYRSGRR